MKVNGSIKVLLMVFFGLYAGVCAAQSPRYIISGEVRDSLTRETLPYANVFLAGTTYGTISDENGRFELNVFDNGHFELVVKFVGFQTFLRKIELKTPELQVIRADLIPEAQNLGTVVVSEMTDREWRRHYKVFEQVFLGRSINGTRSVIKNKSDINFNYDKESQTLLASIESPLQIHNRGLGYSIDYFLEDFIIDYKNGFSKYYGFSFFADLDAVKSKKKRIVKARNTAYRGSVEHFLSAAYNNRLEEEGWIVQTADGVDSKGKIVGVEPIDLDSVIHKSPEVSYQVLTFDGYLYVIYTGELESDEFLGITHQQRANQLINGGPQRSWMKLVNINQGVAFESNGYVLNPVSFIVDGYWRFEKVGEMLPANYLNN